MSDSSYYASDSSDMKDKLYKALLVGGATFGAASLLPFAASGDKWLLNPLQMLSNPVAISPATFLGITGSIASVASDYLHDMVLHQIGLSANIEQNYSTALQVMLGAGSSLGAVYLANPVLAAELGPLVPLAAGAIGEVGGSGAYLYFKNMYSK